MPKLELLISLLKKTLSFLMCDSIILTVLPRKAESQMAEEKRPKKKFLVFGRISIGRMLKWPKLAEFRSSEPPIALSFQST